MPPQCLCVPPKAVCGYGSQDALPFRAIKEGELYFQEDREVNLVDLALATNIPKGCAETAVRGEGLPPPTHTPAQAGRRQGAHHHRHVLLQSTSPTWMEKATWNHREPVRSDGGDARLRGGLVLPTAGPRADLGVTFPPPP